MPPYRRSRARVTVVLGCAALVGVVVLGGVAVTQAGQSPERPSAVQGQPVSTIAQVAQTRIAIAGDTGTGTAVEEATAERMARQAGPDGYDGLLLLGDLVYDEGDPALVDTVVTGPFRAVLAGGAELVPVLGNHDHGSGRADEVLQRLGRSRGWYTEQVGSVRLVVLDTEQVQDPAQTQWLSQVLAESQPSGTWTIVAMHRPAYSAGQHGSSLDVRHAWSDLFARYDVPLVLAGHDHDYQRSVPQDGVVYVVSGAGAKLRPTGSQDFTAVSTSTLHYVDLAAYPDRLDLTAVDQTGDLVDEFTITR
ncbi:MAG: metallophosphoesterase [Nocardioides sp.]|nr:metallophosphoesterase [Nocardioides sp.]